MYKKKTTPFHSKKKEKKKSMLYVIYKTRLQPPKHNHKEKNM